MSLMHVPFPAISAEAVTEKMLFQPYYARVVEEQISLDWEVLSKSLNYDDL